MRGIDSTLRADSEHIKSVQAALKIDSLRSIGDTSRRPKLSKVMVETDQGLIELLLKQTSTTSTEYVILLLIIRIYLPVRCRGLPGSLPKLRATSFPDTRLTTDIMKHLSFLCMFCRYPQLRASTLLASMRYAEPLAPWP